MTIYDFGSGQTISAEDILKASGVEWIDKDANYAQMDGFLKDIVNRSAEVEPVTRALVREATIKHLRSIGIGSPAKIVDSAFGSDYQPAENDDLQGRAITLIEPEPWEEHVEGIELFNVLQATMNRFLILPKSAATAGALWTAHSYAFDYSDVSPIFTLKSPEKRCAKSHFLEVLQCLVCKPLPTSNITPAAIFRIVEQCHPTLLIDEADTFLKHNPELRGIINSGNRKSTATIIRAVGEEHEPRIFTTWSPKSLAMIGEPPETIEDRSIVIPMQRKSPEEKVERLRFDHLNREMEPVRRKIARWIQDHTEQLKSASPDDLAELNDRANDNWRPLLAIADLIGGEWPERARDAARILSGEATGPDNSARVQLLEDLRILLDHDGDQLASTFIVEKLGKMEDRPWPEWKRGKPITTRQLATLLKPFGVTPSQIWAEGKNYRGYTRDALQDAFRRYTTLPNVLEPLEPSTGEGLDPVSHPLEQSDPSGSKIAENPDGDCILAGLADSEGGSGANTPIDEEDEAEFYRSRIQTWENLE